MVVGAFSPIKPNMVSALDLQFDQTDDAGTLKLLNVVDEFTLECPAILVERGIDADEVVTYLEKSPPRKEHGPRSFRPWPRVHRLPGGRLVPLQLRRHHLHRPGNPGRAPGWRASTAAYGTSC